MFKKVIDELLGPCDVHIDGNRPFDIRVHDERLYKSVLSRGSLAFGEAYMKGWWDCADLEELFFRLIRADVVSKIKMHPEIVWYYLRSRLFNMQDRTGALAVARKHYNLGNDLYRSMLGESMMYSCGYWKNASTLDEAQRDKLDLICRKLKLSPGQKVLDIGCGWGGFAHFAAREYGVKVVGVSISEEQVAYAREWCKGLDVEIRQQDYRDLDASFDRIVSIGMFEHVGYKNYKAFMQVVHRQLNPGGIFLLHTIGGNETTTATDPWIHTYIFPNGQIPSPSQVTRAFEPYFMLEDWHNFGPDYHHTLLAWHQNFREGWDQFKQQYGPVFYRMWEYYLTICAASFRARTNQLWQLVLTKKGDTLPYVSER